jgi:pyroglutamyl-peptidase
MNILLTGFGPFADVAANPSERIARHFGSIGFAGHELTCRVLPVSFRRADEDIRRLLKELKPDVALLTGVAGKSSRFRLESLAANEDRARVPDYDGDSPQNCAVVHAGPESLSSHFDLDSIVTRLAAEGFPVDISTNAGRYVCNHTYYAALHEIASTGLATRCLFLHVPPDALTFGPDDDAPRTPLAIHVQVVERILAELHA